MCTPPLLAGRILLVHAALFFTVYPSSQSPDSPTEVVHIAELVQHTTTSPCPMVSTILRLSASLCRVLYLYLNCEQ